MNPYALINRLDKQIDILYSLREVMPNLAEVPSLISLLYSIKSSSKPMETKISMMMSYNLQSRLTGLFEALPDTSSLLKIKNDFRQNSLEISPAMNDSPCCCGEPVDSEGVCRKCVLEQQNSIGRNVRTREENIVQHLLAWMDRIQGIENISISKDDIRRLVDKIRRENTTPNGRMLDISEMDLQTLKFHMGQLNLSSLYKNIIKVRRLVMLEFNIQDCEVRIHEKEKEVIIRLFNIVHEIFEEIKNNRDLLAELDVNEINNLPYYPFILSKLLPLVIQDIRIHTLLNNITKQAKETSIKNDKLWNYIKNRNPLLDREHIV